MAVGLVMLALGRPVRAAPGGVHHPPVAGRVVAGFEAPESPYGAGHRGVDLAVGAGAAVRASAAGRVAFAGVVAGTAWVSVDHPSGIRTSYGPVAEPAVASGDAVVAGAVLGTAAATGHGGGGRLHWGARFAGRYLDPLALTVAPVAALVGPGGWRGGDLPPVPGYDDWDGRHVVGDLPGPVWIPVPGLVPGSPEATGPGWLDPPNPNRVIGLAGLGSGYGGGPFDLTHLGYDRSDVTLFSYAGLDADGAPRPYGPAATHDGVRAAAARLERHLREQWRREPGRAVDLVGHSMGGVVALYYLLVRHDPTDPGLPPIGHVATVASPLEGADAAALVAGLRGGMIRRVVVDALAAPFGHDPGARSVTDLAPGSPVVDALTAGWRAARSEPSAGPLAVGTEVATFGGSRDLVVPEHRSDLPGAEHGVLPGGHDGIRRTEAARIAVRAFLAGEPVPGEAGGLGWLLSHPLSWVDEVAGRLDPGAAPGLAPPGLP